ERAVLLRTVEHRLHVRDAEILGDVHAHRRQLERHVRVQLLLMDAVEDLEIRLARRARLALVRDALAEEVERGGDVPRVEVANREEGFVERFTGDEARGELLGELVVSDEPENARLIREIEER